MSGYGVDGYPTGWTDEQRRRFENTSALLGVEGLWDRGRFVHVTGTNGKGSTCAFIAGILRAAGYKTGLFTSPHLYSETERIIIDGEPIAQARLDSLMAEADAAADRLPGFVSLFERYMYAALKYFEAEGVDVAVIETGIGGTMDCTNIISPEVCVCCTIGLDHTEMLGGTVREIAVQKAGIAKPDIPFVLYPRQDEGIPELVLGICEQHGADLHDMLMADIKYSSTLHGQSLWCKMSGFGLEDARINMIGRHQIYNAATAAYSAWLLNRRGLRISGDDIRAGLEQTSWPARMQLLPGGQEADLMLDGAHNPEALIALINALDEYYPKRKKAMLAAVMRDKNVAEMAGMLARYAQEQGNSIVCTCADSERGMPAQEFAELCGAEAFDADPHAALAMAKQLAGKGGLVVACGSLYLPGVIA